MSTAPAPTERRPDRARPRARTRRRRVEGLERLRILLAGAMGAVLVGYALLVPVAALLLASGGSGAGDAVDGSFATAVPLWLAAHLISIEVDGRPLGVLPLLPTGVVVLVVATASAWSVRRLGGRLRHDAGAVVAGQAGAAATVAVLAGALLPGDVGVATPWASMVGAGLLAGLGAAAGVVRTCGLPPAWSRRLRGWPLVGIAGARAGALGLVLSGSLVLLAATAIRAGDVATSFAALAPGVGAGAGVLLLTLGYLPNAVAAGTSWTLGAGLTVGAGRYGPFGTLPGALPPFPLFATLSPEPAPAWTVLVLLLPLGTGVLVGRVCRRGIGSTAPLRDRLAASGAAALLTAAGVAVVTALAGGSLAGGPYDPVSLSPAAAGAAALLLLGLPATVACAGADELLGRPPARAARASRPRPGVARGTRATRAGGEAAGRGPGQEEEATTSRGHRRENGAADHGPARDERGRARAGRGRRARPDELADARRAQRRRAAPDPDDRPRPRTVGELVAATEQGAERGTEPGPERDPQRAEGRTGTADDPPSREHPPDHLEDAATDGPDGGPGDGRG